MKKTRWALIGCGKVILKNKYTPFINRNNKIVAICTTNIKNSNYAKDKLKLSKCNCYSKVKEMLDNEMVDALYICTPPKYHYIYLKEVYNRNIPVIYVEKPFVLNDKEAIEISTLYQNNNTKIFVAHYKRLTRKFKKLKKMINQKLIGDIISVEGCFYRTFNKKLLNSWIYNKDISGGGRFFDIAPHIIDIIYYIFGDISNIKSNVYYDSKLHNCETKVVTKFNCNDIKIKLNFELEQNEDKDEIIINGTKGYIKTSINRDMPILIYKNNKLIKTIKTKKSRAYGMETIKEINKFLNNKKYIKDLVDLKQAVKIQSYIDKILKK